MPTVRESPFAPMLLDGVTERRCDLTDGTTVKGVPVFEELQAAGMTEWLGRIFPMGELVPQFGWTVEAEHAEQLALVCSLTTDRPGGYSEADLAVLSRRCRCSRSP